MSIYIYLIPPFNQLGTNGQSYCSDNNPLKDYNFQKIIYDGLFFLFDVALDHLIKTPSYSSDPPSPVGQTRVFCEPNIVHMMSRCLCGLS
jgi:hypothetical protein